MVKNLKRFERKMGRIPRLVRDAAREGFMDSANKITNTMRRFLASHNKTGALSDSIGWVWGDDLPDGAFTLGSVGRPTDAEFFITIFAGNKEAFQALWHEFGTDAHSLAKNASTARGLRQDQGTQHPGTSPSPFFYPAWRLHKRSVRGDLSRRVNKKLKQLKK